MNRRARKLRYIRMKNSIRKGLLVRGSFIIKETEAQTDGFLEERIKEEAARYEKIYKTPMKIYGINGGRLPAAPDSVAIKYTVKAEGT